MIFIQKSHYGILPHHFDAASALYGAFDSGVLKYKLVTFDEVKEGKYDLVIDNNLFVGSVEFMTEVFRRVGITLDCIQLPRNSDRFSEILTLGEVKNRVKAGGKYFIKPLPTELKSFTGFVIDEMVYSSIANISDDTYVRVYVHKNKIKDMHNYSGDLFQIPHRLFIEDIIEENKKDFPSTYIIDVGILRNELNVVVEFNDMWSIGNYGVPNDTYYRMLVDRYFDIIITSDRVSAS